MFTTDGYSIKSLSAMGYLGVFINLFFSSYLGVFINLNTKNDSIKLESQYSKLPGDLIPDLNWSHSIPNCNKLILGGDFNAHLQAWSYKGNNARGENLQDYISLNDLYVINGLNTENTYQHNNKKGNPDLMLSRLEARHLFDS